MKILVCNKFYRPVGGPETIMIDTMRELEALGHAAIPFAMAHPDNLPSEYADYFVSNIDYNERRGGAISQKIREALGLVYSSEARRNIERLIADTKPDIAHAHNIYHQLSPSILMALQRAGVPTVLTLHDGKLLCANMLFLTHGRVCEKCAGRRFYNAVINRCVKDSIPSSALCFIEETVHRTFKMYERNVDLFITPSRFLKQKLVEHGRLSEESIEVLPNYADTKSIQPDFNPGNYGLFVGRLEPLKGIMTLLRACAEAPGLEMRLAGRGPMLEEGERFAESEGLDKVKFLGFQTGEALSRLFREARFVVLPSECYENCPMAILEAFSAGKPVIASRTGGIPELIEDSVDGLLFEPGDAQGLAACIRRLVINPALTEAMGRKGRAKVEERFTMQAYVERLLCIYGRMTKLRRDGAQE